MRVLAVADLKPAAGLSAPLYDKSGQIVLAEGESLSRERIRILSDCGIRVVFAPEPGENAEAFFGERGNVPVEVESLPVGTHTTQPLRDANGVLLLKDGAEITREFLESFRRRGIRFLYVDQTEPERQAGVRSLEDFRVALESDRRQRMEAQLGKLADAPVVFGAAELVANPAELEPAALERRIEQELLRAAEEPARPAAAEPAEATGPGEPESFESEIKVPAKEQMRSAEEKGVFLDAYAGMVRELRKLYDQLRKGRPVTSGAIGQVVGEAMVIVRDIDLFLSMAARPQTDDRCVAHAIRAGLFALAIGLNYRYGRKRIFELAHAAFLVDIGMLRVPREILNKTVTLTDPERAELRRHVHYGLDLARSVSGVPWISACTIYQSHERCDGSGYHEHRKGPRIIPAAKIVAVADVYAALCEPRPHRPALLPYRAMETVVRMGGINWLEPNAIRGLLRYLSLFPVGSWAELTTGEKVRVVSANPEDFMRPVVSVVYNRAGAPVEPFRINLLKFPHIRIRRALDPESLEPPDDPLRGF
jgi:HD-GYP domain-containing protein (c-di-GMP phosphodiesterase class II)